MPLCPLQRAAMPTPMIVLMRHAEPDFDTSMRVRTSDMSGVLAAYDEAGIKWTRDGRRTGEIIPHVVGKEGRDGSSVQVVTSNLRRSIESARLFFPHLEPAATDMLYREAELPAKLPLGGLAMRYSTAVGILRILWMFGIHQQAESYAMAVARARRAAEALAGRAMEHGCVVLVGHGFFNRLIDRELTRNGWTAIRREGGGFGASTTFQYRDLSGSPAAVRNSAGRK